MRQYFPRLWYDHYPLYARGLSLCLLCLVLFCTFVYVRMYVSVRSFALFSITKLAGSLRSLPTE